MNSHIKTAGYDLHTTMENLLRAREHLLLAIETAERSLQALEAFVREDLIRRNKETT